jgi:hypothetical protein
MTDETKTEPVAPENKADAVEISAPKKRGRPPKNPPADGNAKPVTDDGKGTTSKPGRRKGKVSFTGEDIKTLGKQIVGLHKLAYLATGIPELEISEQEGDLLGGALATVAQEYDLELSGKTGAMLQLVAACGMIYVPRFIALQKRVAIAKAQQKAALHVVGGTDTSTSN